MLKSNKKLLALLGITADEYQEITANLDLYYYEQRKNKLSKRGKHQFQNGKIKERVIYPSLGQLKEIQIKIKNMLDRDIQFPTYYWGGIKEKDNIRNARYHQGNHFFFLSDLKNFFPSIKSSMVYNTLLHLGYSADVSHKITKLCTYKGALPQGTPTSTIIANLSTLQMTSELNDLCIENSIRFTIFVDDLTFSSQVDFKDLTGKIIAVIKSYGFCINNKKTSYKKGKASVTGVIVRQNKTTPPSYLNYKLKKSETSEEKKHLSNYIDRITKKTVKPKLS